MISCDRLVKMHYVPVFQIVKLDGKCTKLNADFFFLKLPGL